MYVNTFLVIRYWFPYFRQFSIELEPVNDTMQLSVKYIDKKMNDRSVDTHAFLSAKEWQMIAIIVNFGKLEIYSNIDGLLVNTRFVNAVLVGSSI